MTDNENRPIKLEVFDPPMCCSTGVCGPNVDKRLVAFAANLDWIRSRGIRVERYNPSHQYEAFSGNEKVVRAVNDHGMVCLPLILLGGEIVSHGVYPAREELAAMAGLGSAATTAHG
jgi:hypothetical protein